MIFDTEPLWAAWFVGFFDGEGHLQLMPQSKGGRYSSCCQLGLREDDHEIISEIQSKLGCGRIFHINNYSTRRQRPGSRDQKRWRCCKIADVAEILVPLFDAIPFRTKKRDEYRIWREATMLIRNGANLSPEGKAVLYELAEALKAERIYSKPV